MTAATNPRSTFAQRWKEKSPEPAFWRLAAATALFNVGVSSFVFLYSLFLMEHGYSESSVGMVASATLVGSLVGTLPVGVLAGRFGLQRVMSVGLLTFPLIYALKACLLTLGAQLALGFIGGLVLCGWSVCLSPLVANTVSKDRRPTAYSILFATAVVSCGVGGLLGGHLPSWFALILPAGLDKQATLIGCCLLVGLAAWPVWRLKTGPDSYNHRMQWLQLDPFLTRFFIASGCWCVAVGCFTPFVSIFFGRYLGVPLPRLGTLFSISQALEATAMLAVPVLLRRLHLVNGLVALQLTSAVALAMMATGHGWLQAAAALCLHNSAQHMCDPGIQTLMMNHVATEDRSGASAVYFLVMSLAQAGASLMGGIVASRFGYRALLLVAAATASLAALLFRVLIPREASIAATVSQESLV